jgi:hypothetical protein
MFFVRQQGNKCGLHALQNMFKSADMSEVELHEACNAIHKETGDAIENHESLNGYWSVDAMSYAMTKRGYDVQRAIVSGLERQWSGPDIDTLIQEPNFRGVILHQPLNQHYTCVRPEGAPGERSLYYVDSQSSGPIKISPHLVKNRCVSTAYAWEPFVVRGEDMVYKSPAEQVADDYDNIVPVALQEIKERPVVQPPESFLKEWREFNENRQRLE